MTSDAIAEATANVIEGDRIVRDPVYGYVRIPDRLAPIIDAPIFQRLRRIKQNALTLAVYPSANGTRFEHSLGAMHLAGLAWSAAWQNSPAPFKKRFTEELQADFPYLQASATDFDEEVRLAVMGVALMHDVGHPPFSHTLEPVYEEQVFSLFAEDESIIERMEANEEPRRPFHEVAGEIILETFLLSRIQPPEFRELLHRIFSSSPRELSPFGVLHSVVAGELDVDRLDYLLRDAGRSGTEFGAIDWQRYIDALALGPFIGSGWKIAPKARAHSAVETLLIQRFQAYRWVFLHHRVVATSMALSSAVNSMVDLSAVDAPPEFGIRRGFQRCVPRLNYLKPASGSLSVYQSDEMECARVDDSTVNDMLLDGRQEAVRILSEGGDLISESIQSRLRHLIADIDIALFRQKYFYSVWKSEHQFATFAKAAVLDTLNSDGGALKAAFDDAFDELSALQSADTQALAAVRENLMVGWDHQPEAFVNRVLLQVLGRPEQREEFATRLDAQPAIGSGYVGHWRIQRVDFKPLNDDRDALDRVWGTAWTTLRVSEGSTLVSALLEAESRRPHFYFGLFIEAQPTGASRLQDWADAVPGIEGRLYQELAGWVRHELVEVWRHRADTTNGSPGGH